MPAVLSGILFYVVIPLAILNLLVLIHEAGHFFAAIKCGIGVKEFAIGMGPKIFSKVATKRKILFSLRALPIGGFVSMVGEDEESDRPDAFNKKPVWKRIVVIVTGASMNIVLGFIVMAIYLSGVKAFPMTKILAFNADSKSDKTGLQVGDQITKIGNKSTNIANDISFALLRNGDAPVDVTVIRNGEKIVVGNVVFPTIEEEGIRFGLTDFRVNYEEKTAFTLIKQAYLNSVAMVELVWSTLYDLVTGKYSINTVSGPVGITQEIGNSAKAGMPYFLYLIALITINMGVVNLLPIPAMDGSRLVFLLIELVRGKPVKPEYEGYVHLAGLFVMFAFMIFITFKDIQHYFLN